MRLTTVALLIVWPLVTRALATLAYSTEPALIDGARRVTLLQADSALKELLSTLKPKTADSTANADVAEPKPDQGLTAPFLAYPLAFSIVVCVLLFIFVNRGWKVVLSVVTYVMTLSTMKLVVKWVFVQCSFTFPKFVTMLHFMCGGMVCLVVLVTDPSRSCVCIAVPTTVELFFMIVPIAMAASVFIACSNMALGFSSVAFAEIIGATFCFTTVAIVLILGMPFDYLFLAPISAVVMGC